MSKVVVLGDLHVGTRNGNLHVAEYQIKFFEDVLLPYMLKEKIDTILQLGDIFDVRKFSNHIILDMWQKRVFDVLESKNIQFHTVLGNHDLALKNTLSVNSPKLFLGDYSNIKIYDSPSDVKIGNLDFLLIPWICSENEEDCTFALKNTKSIFCAGHFEINGFSMHKGQSGYEGGLSRAVFDKFSSVLSGHFHTRSSDGTVYYTGTPYELTWIDYGDPKGFHVLDTSNQHLEFIENPLKLFNKIKYDDRDHPADYHKSFDLSNLKLTYTKVVVLHKEDPKEFERLMDKLYKIQFLSLDVVEDMSMLEADDVVLDDFDIEDTRSLIRTYVEASDFEMDKERLKNNMSELYIEALGMLE